MRDTINPSRAKKYALRARSPTARGIPQRVVDALVEVNAVDDRDLTLDSLLVMDLGLDEFDLAELAMDLERSYRIVIGDEVLEDWVTVQDVVDTVERAG